MEMLQALQLRVIARIGLQRGVEKETAILPGQHLADIVRLDQPATARPAHKPHAHLLSDSCEGVRLMPTRADGGDGIRRLCRRGPES